MKTTMITETILSPRKYRNKEIPRFLYTITTKQNYESMCRDGYIRMAKDPICCKMCGIFMFDLRNFTKRWARNFFFRNRDMATELLVNTSDKGKNIVILKIPTKELTGDLRIRSLSYLFKNCDKYHTNEHLDVGLSATLQKRYTQHKDSIEYIYKENLPINKVEKIGELFIDDQRKLAEGKLSLKNLLLELFKGTPQQRTIEQMP